jgi:hypothetical protein
MHFWTYLTEQSVVAVKEQPGEEFLRNVLEGGLRTGEHAGDDTSEAGY